MAGSDRTPPVGIDVIVNGAGASDEFPPWESGRIDQIRQIHLQIHLSDSP